MQIRTPTHANLAGISDPGTRVDGIACVAITLLVFGVKLFLLEPIGPVLFYDELLYKLGADALHGVGRYPSGQYPPLYSAMLAPGLAAGWGYAGIFYANAIASTAIIPASWLLAREVGMRWAWPAALLCSLLPIHWTYPTQVLSENLSVPLFLWVTWYAVRARPTSVGPAALFGVGLAGLALTKYLLLPSIPVLWAIWLYGMHARTAAAHGGAGRLVAPALASVIGVVAPIVGWLAYAHSQDIGIGDAFGAKVVKFKAKDLVTPDILAMWGVAYLSCIVLLAAPFLPRLAEAGLAMLRSPLRSLRESPLARLFLLAALLLAGYWLVCARHSAFGIGNYPVPQRVIVRYFMHLTPVVMVLGLALTQAPLRRTNPWLTAMLALGSCGLVLASHRILFDDAIWDFPDWFARIPLYSTDIRGYEASVHIYALACLVLLSALTPLHPIARKAWLACLFVFLGASTALTFKIVSRNTSIDPLHAKNLAPLVIAATRTHERVVVITEIGARAGIPRVMQQALRFWGADPDKFRVVGPNHRIDAGPSTVVYRITTRKLGKPALRDYGFGRSSGYIYEEDRAPQGPAARATGTVTLRPTSLCKGDAVAASLSWNAGAGDVRKVAIYIAGTQGTERLFSVGPPIGSRQTPPWARPGMRFVLRDDDSGRLLAQAAIQQRECN